MIEHDARIEQHIADPCPVHHVFGPLVAAELCTGRSESLQDEMQSAEWQRPLCAVSGHYGGSLRRQNPAAW
jgi:hypothetical protein